MSVIRFGVLELPYSQEMRDDGQPVTKGNETTGDVAEWLENRYNVIGTYLAEREDFVGEQIALALSQRLELAVINGLDSVMPSIADFAGEEIAKDFRIALDIGILEGIAPGTPTKAAMNGRTSRRKNRVGPIRKSFIDTGLYQKSFRVWGE